MKSYISDDQKEYEKITKSFEYELLSWSNQEDQSSFSIYKKASDSRVDVKGHLVLSWTDDIIEIRKVAHLYETADLRNRVSMSYDTIRQLWRPV